jgi:Zn ribbon nucleic-acid-binding protein
MKITKKPKKVKIFYRTIESSIAGYICPSCHTQFETNLINEKVTRFICKCGQELIIEKDNKNVAKN